MKIANPRAYLGGVLAGLGLGGVLTKFLIRHEGIQMLEGELFLVLPFLLIALGSWLGRSRQRQGEAGREESNTALSAEFLAMFGPESGLEPVDFRPHFEGSLWNAHRLSERSATREAHVALVWTFVREMAAWIMARRERFESGDRFQLIVGWPESVRITSRQIVKLGGGFDALERIAAAATFAAYHPASDRPVFLPGWDRSIYE
jgi:hypothetical protein